MVRPFPFLLAEAVPSLLILAAAEILSRVLGDTVTQALLPLGLLVIIFGFVLIRRRWIELTPTQLVVGDVVPVAIAWSKIQSIEIGDGNAIESAIAFAWCGSEFPACWSAATTEPNARWSLRRR